MQHPSLLWMMTTAWPLEDAAILTLPPDEQEGWSDFYQRMAKLTRLTGRYHPLVQTNWY